MVFQVPLLKNLLVNKNRLHVKNLEFKTRMKKLRLPCSMEDNPPLLCTDVDETDRYKFIKKFIPTFPMMFNANHFNHENFKSLFRYVILIRPQQTLVYFDVHIAHSGGQLTMILALNPPILEIFQISA